MDQRFALATLGLLLACNDGATEESVCLDLCTELKTVCGYEAFPDITSCQQGCEWNAEGGADIAGQTACVQAAACDTFAIVECEHAHGAQ